MDDHKASSTCLTAGMPILQYCSQVPRQAGQHKQLLPLVLLSAAIGWHHTSGRHYSLVLQAAASPCRLAPPALAFGAALSSHWLTSYQWA